MLIFVNKSGQALVTTTALESLDSFSLPVLDQQFSAVVLSTTLTPKPVLQVQGSLGNKNYLNIFGEDPLQITINGLVAGSACRSLLDIQATTGVPQSAVGVAIDFYSQYGVINRPMSLQYNVRGRPTQEAFLVGLTVIQDSDIADLARFDMLLLADSLQRRNLATIEAPPRLQTPTSPFPWPDNLPGNPILDGISGSGGKIVTT